MERLKKKQDDCEIFDAGHPHFPRNFSRDSLISAILLEDPIILKNQLRFSAKKQGRGKNPMTGEEDGKIFHEFPGVIINDLSTEFNACDTTALFLIGHQHYFNLTNDRSLIEEQKENIIFATEYIKAHLKDFIFYEDPKFSEANKYALKVTYWKDSAIIKRENGEPLYPVSYFLAHVINIAGIRAGSVILGSEELKNISLKMTEKIHDFIDRERKKFFIAIDKSGEIDGINSDILHALFYLEPGDLYPDELNYILEISKELETEIGYVTSSPKILAETKDNYHLTTVWPYEQAMINIGAKKFGLTDVFDVSKKIIPYLDSEPEIFIVSEGKIIKGGCDPQLWTIAAKKYFEKIKITK